MTANPAPQIQAVVFDLDGLMLNTEDVFTLAGKELLACRDLTMTEEIHHAMLGRRPDEAFQAMKDLTGISDSIDDLKQEVTILFNKFAENHLAMMPGLLPLLDVIESTGLPKAVATSSPRDYLISMLNQFDLENRFQFTLAAEDVQHGKPNPEIYLKAANLLGVPTQNILVLEDSQTGTTAAAAAGTFAVSVPNQHTEFGDFSMASMVVKNLESSELLSLFKPFAMT